jgi:hypothetical protein
VRALVAVLVLAAALVGGAGLGALLVERRLAGLAPGGVEFATLHYNPFTGRLVLGRLRAHDAAGREVFRAEHVRAVVAPVSLLTGALTLGRVQMTEPRLTLRVASGLGLDDVARALLDPGGTVLPLRVDDLVIDDGVLIVEGAGEGGAALVARDLDLRLGRLTTATVGEHDVAFVVEMAVYGTVVRVTGQPRGGAYALRVRARGLDAAAVARDVRAAVLDPVERGRADVDAHIVLAGGRVLVSGSVRLADAVLRLPLPGTPRLRASLVAVAADAFDLADGTGRLARVDLVAPTLVVPAGTTAAVLGALTAPDRTAGSLLIRRVSIADGTLAIEGRYGLRLTGLELAAQLTERRPETPGWFVKTRAVLGRDGEVSLEGLVDRDLRWLDAGARVQRVPLAQWRALGGPAPGWDAHVSFDGRVHVVLGARGAAATLTGHAELEDVREAAADGFRAERVALGIRRLRWPDTEAVLDRVVVTRPAFGLGTLARWTEALVTGGMSVVDGEMIADPPGRALHRLTVELGRDAGAGLARVRVSAATAAGVPVDLERVVPHGSGEPGVPLRFLAATLGEATRVAASLGASSAP